MSGSLLDTGPRPAAVELAGRFLLIRELGEGGHGVVYEALDQASQTRLALKTLPRLDPDGLLRFKEEFRSLQDVEHENLVRLGELAYANGLWFFTMELVEGTDFFDYVRPVVGRVAGLKLRKLDEGRLRGALVQLVRALLTLHGSGRVHRDVKPSNIRVDAEGRLVLLDFGLVASLARPRRGTKSNVVLGTPAYMAPEQCRGEPATVGQDWYAVGVLLYEALTGRLPFDGELTQLCFEKQHAAPQHPLELAPGGPKDLADACMRLLTIDPAERASGSHLLAVLLADNDVDGAFASPEQRWLGAAHEVAPFVGRQAELLVLDRHFKRTKVLEPAFAYVSGESGVGKTALVRAFADRQTSREGALVLRGRCHERESVPYKAFDAIVDDLAYHLSTLPEALVMELLPSEATLLPQLFPVLGRVPALKGLTAAPLPQDLNVFRASAFAALREILARLALRAPLLLLIDDLQWADADSFALLTDLLFGTEAPNALVLTTGRPRQDLPAEVEAGLAPILSQPLALELPLGGLPEAESIALARSVAGRFHEPAILARIASEANGHPLFVAELTRHLEKGAELATNVQLDDALSARIAVLEPGARALLETLAVAGAPTDHATLSRALSLGQNELARGLSQLRGERLIRNERAGRAECYHDRVKKTVLEGLETTVLMKRHHQLASALSFLSTGDPGELAYQWRCAGEVERAVRLSADAAETARKALAFGRAVRHYEDALSTPEVFASDELVSLRAAFAETLSCAGFSARAAEEYLALSASVLGAAARAYRAKAAQLMLRSGRIIDGLAISDGVFEEVGMSRPKTPTRALLTIAWERARLSGKFAARSARRAPDPREREQLELLWSVAPALAFVDVLGGSALQSRYARLSLSNGDPAHVIRSLTIEAMLRSTTEVAPQSGVEAILEEVREAAARSDSPYVRGLVWMAHGYVHWVNFRLNEALSSLVQAERIFRESCVDVAWELTNVRAALLNAYWNSGRLAHHREFSQAFLREARERGDLYAAAQLTFLGLGYEPFLRADDVQRAEDELEKGLCGWPAAFQLPQWGQYIGRLLLGLYRGDGSGYAQLEAHSRVLQRSQLGRVAYLSLLTHADAAWTCLDEWGRAPQAKRADLLMLAEQHARALSKTRWPLSEALTQQIRAQVLLASGQEEDALPLLLSAAHDMKTQHPVYHHATLNLMGQVIGGQNGKALITRAAGWASAQGVADPERWFCLFAPAIRFLRQ